MVTVHKSVFSAFLLVLFFTASVPAENVVKLNSSQLVGRWIFVGSSYPLDGPSRPPMNEVLFSLEKDGSASSSQDQGMYPRKGTWKLKGGDHVEMHWEDGSSSTYGIWRPEKNKMIWKSDSGTFYHVKRI
jgi:hypothetical protein